MSFQQDNTPRNIEAEENFLSICMKNGDAWCKEDVDPKWFFDSKHSAIAYAMAKLHRESKPINAANIIEVCINYGGRGKDVLKAAGGEEYIRALQAKSVNHRQSQEMLRIIRNASTSRQLMAVADKIRDIACSDDTDPFSKISSGIDLLASIKSTPTTESFEDISNRYEQILEARIDGELVNRVKTGIFEFDAHLCGLEKGTYTIIGANSSAGKTAMQMQLNWQMIELGYKGFFASIEMSETAVMDRLLTLVSGVPMDTIAKGRGLKFNIDRVRDALARVRKTVSKNLVIDFSDSMTPSEFKSRAKQAEAKLGGLDFASADYLQFMHHEKNFSGRPELVQNLSFEMKSISKSLGVANIVAAQLNIEAAKSEEPELWHIAESSQVWRDADYIFLMHTEQFRSDGARNVVVNLKKARNDALASFKFKFVPSVMKFMTYDGVSGVSGAPGRALNPPNGRDFSTLVDETISKSAWDNL